MAVIQDRERDGLRLGRMQNLCQESLVWGNYVSDAIRSYGVDIRYYKLKTPYPEVFKPILDANHLSMHAYGEEFAQEWEDPVRMVAHVSFESDGLVLNSYGVQPESAITMYLDQSDFAVAMARKLSRWREYPVVGRAEFILDFDSDQDLIRNRDSICIDFETDLFSGQLQAILTDSDLDSLLAQDSCPELEVPISIPCRLLSHGPLRIDTGRINPLLYKGDHYDPWEDGLVDCHLHLEVRSVLRDRHGCIRAMGSIRGGAIWHDTEVVGKYLDKVQPEVGDLVDIPLPGPDGQDSQVYNFKYEIVELEQSAANEAVMNPFLRTYMYQCRLRAYVSSGQQEPGGQSEAQTRLKDRLDLVNAATEEAAKRLSLYEDFEDDAYGGYQRVDRRKDPSVVRQADTATVNDFDPPAKKKGLRKSTVNLFAFADWKMVLQLVEDQRENRATLRLTPLRKSLKVDPSTNLLDFLRADDDDLCLVAGHTHSYLLAGRFSVPELDDSGCVKPIRLKKEVYAQHGGWADQPFHLVDAEDEVKLSRNLQELVGRNTAPEFSQTSENRICFPNTLTFLEVEHQRLDDGREIWTCFVQFAGDPSQTRYPICSCQKAARG